MVGNTPLRRSAELTNSAPTARKGRRISTLAKLGLAPQLTGEEVLEQGFDGAIEGAFAVVADVAEGRLLDGK